MEEDQLVHNIVGESLNISSGTKVPNNVGLCSRPEPILPSLSPCTSSLPPQSSAVRALQTKVKTLSQSRQRGREREREKDRDKVDTEVLVNQLAGQISLEGLSQQRTRGRGKVPLPVPAWHSGSGRTSSSSEEEEEVELQVRLEIHSPPPVTQEEKANQAAMGKVTEKGSEVTFSSGQPRGLGEGASLESLISDSLGSQKDEPSPPLPAGSSSSFPVTSASFSSSTSSSTSSSSSRHWAPPKGFWRVARPETLLLNGVRPHHIPASLPLKDYTQISASAEPQRKPKTTETETRSDGGSAVGHSDALLELKHSDSLVYYLDRSDQKDAEANEVKEVKELWRSGSWESLSSQSGTCSADEKVEVKQKVYGRTKERRRHNSREEKVPSGGDSSICHKHESSRTDCKGAFGFSDNDSDSTVVSLELEPCSRSLFPITDELPLSPRHEQAKRVLERARLKARSNHIKGDHPPRRSHSDQRCNTKRQQIDPTNSAPLQQVAVESKEELPTPPISGPLLIPDDRDSSASDQGDRSSRQYGSSPTRVRFEDESEKEAESRYLNRVWERGRPGGPKSRIKTEKGSDSSSSGSERRRAQRSVSIPPPQKHDDGAISGECTTVIKEIIVVVTKCEACGSVVREPPSVITEPLTAEQLQSGNPQDVRGKMVPRWTFPNKPEGSTRPKPTLSVTFAGAFVLGGNKESNTGWRTSSFGKLRRRSRKGESRLESGRGPYGPSWAQRRNSNSRSRVNPSRAVSFAPGSPIALEPHLLEASGGLRETSTPSMPIKSALKSSSKYGVATSQSTGQFQMTSNQVGGEGDSQHLALLDPTEPRREAPMALTQGNSTQTSLVPCIRPSTLRYSQARLPPDLPSAEIWDVTPDGKGPTLSGDSGSECRPSLRSVAMSRSEDLRAELLRSEYLKAEAMWEDNSDGSRKTVAERDGRPKLSLRRFFSSIGLNSVGRLVKGGRSSSMEQLSIPGPPRASSASPSPTRRPQSTTRIQRTPSLQTLHTVLPLAQLRKAASVQSLERRTERSTILGEVQIPYGLAPSPDSPQIEIHRALSLEDVLSSRVVRPVGRVTQAFPDGTLLLELTRPPNGPFGFVISRGKGRPDTGVYIEKVRDSAGEGLYMGLLSVGDEILQVNGEAVAGLTLDQVTRLMTRDSTASIRIMPSRHNPR